MSKTIYYRQCHLVLAEPKGELHQVSWIPETFAVAGKTLRLREGDWQDGWVVRFVGPYRMAEQELPDPHRDIKRHRRATGDAIPRSPGEPHGPDRV